MTNKQAIKIFLKPNWKKILLTTIFMVLFFIFGIASFIQQGDLGPHDFPFITPFYGEFSTICDTVQDSIYCRLRGFPFPYFQMEECSMRPFLPAFNTRVKWLFIGLVLDLIFWYFISCLIISVWTKLRNRR